MCYMSIEINVALQIYFRQIILLIQFPFTCSVLLQQNEIKYIICHFIKYIKISFMKMKCYVWSSVLAVLTSELQEHLILAHTQYLQGCFTFALDLLAQVGWLVGCSLLKTYNYDIRLDLYEKKMEKRERFIFF